MDPRCLRTGIIAALIVLGSASIPIKNEVFQAQRDDADIYRLPSGVVPLHYNLTVTPNLEDGDFSFTGTVVIKISVTEPTNRITLHSDMLNITETSTVVLHEESNITVPIFVQSYDTLRQFYIVNLYENLQVGDYYLILEFTGEIRDDFFGFYRSYYDVDGERRWIALTQFAPTYARRAFPCFDEPGLKATFDIRIRHYQHQVVRANTDAYALTIPQDSTERMITQFATTPRMSTYLVAYIVSDFTSLQNHNQSFNVWLRESAASTGTFALQQGELQYNALAQWINVTNNINKIDQVAIPDFSFGAMENWGMITYRETLLLHEDSVSTSRATQSIATIMSHEFAHIWFGNTVTPTWWDYVWLSEGFATYFEYFGPSLVHTTWRLMELFVVEVQQPVMITDSSESTRAMNGEGIGTPATISASLDAISYSKAGSVVRMLTYFIGEDAFRNGLQNYLRNMSGTAASPSDLYPHLQSASDQSGVLQRHIYIDQILDSWASQPGYPLVTVTRNYTTRVLEVSQERFYMKRESPTADPEGYRWWIPLNFATELVPGNFEVTNSVAWLRAQDKSLMVSGFDPDAWVIYNVQQSGYYRVNYDNTNWNMIIEYLRGENYTIIPPLNRASLLDDSLNLARAGYIDYSTPLNLTKYLVSETDYVPWVSATNCLAVLDRMLSGHQIHSRFQSYVKSLVSPLHLSLTFEENFSDDHITKLLRNLILTWACGTNDGSCRHDAAVRFNGWISNPVQTVPADLKSVIYCWGLRAGTESDWNIVWDRYLETDLASEEVLLLTSLGCTQNAALINRYLNLSIIPESGIREQNRLTVFNSLIASSLENVDIVFEFVRNNFKTIAELRGYGVLGNMLSILGNRMVTTDQLERFREFVNENTSELGTAAAVGLTAIAAAEENLAWIDEYAPSIVDWLSDNVEQTSGAMSISANILASTIFILVTALNYLL